MLDRTGYTTLQWNKPALMLLQTPLDTRTLQAGRDVPCLQENGSLRALYVAAGGAAAPAGILESFHCLH
eukprot:14580696-Alexandrium_andersonii.AAC.1